MVFFLVRLLMFLAILWLIRRFIAFWTAAAKQKAGKAHDPSPRATSHTVRDPVCGMYMDPRLALRVQDGEEALFFCSDACRQKFLAQPR